MGLYFWVNRIDVLLYLLTLPHVKSIADEIICTKVKQTQKRDFLLLCAVRNNEKILHLSYCDNFIAL